MPYFDDRLNMILEDVLNENVLKKWPHIVNKIMLPIARVWPNYPNNREKGMSNLYDSRRNRFVIFVELQARYSYFQENPEDNSDNLDGFDYIGDYLNAGKHSKSLNEFQQFLILFDPVAERTKGKKTPYLNKIVDWMLSGYIDANDDQDIIHTSLSKYHDLKHNQGMDLPPIEEIHNPGDLRELVQFDKEQVHHTSGFMYEDTNEYGTFKVYELLNYKDAEDALCDSGWCVGGQEFFEEYMETGPLFLITKQYGRKKEKRYALIHPATPEIKDVHNRTMTLEYAKPLYDIFDKLFNLEREITSLLRGGYRSDVAVFLQLYPEMLEDQDLRDIVQYTQNAPEGFEWPPEIRQKIYEDPTHFSNYVYYLDRPSHFSGPERDQGSRPRSKEIEEVIKKQLTTGGGGWVSAALNYFVPRMFNFKDLRWPELEKEIISSGDGSAISGYDLQRLQAANFAYSDHTLNLGEVFKAVNPGMMLSDWYRQMDFQQLISSTTHHTSITQMHFDHLKRRYPTQYRGK